ncbi:MAG: archease [Nanoarchaeota archaeon]
MGYKFLEHTADLKIVVEEKTLENAFKTSVMALKEAIAEKIKIKPSDKKLIAIKGEDLLGLLYKFLEEFLFLLDAKGFLVSEVEELKIVGDKKNGYILNAEVSGDKASRYKFSNSVKAITFNEMIIEDKNGKFKIQFVLDV